MLRSANDVKKKNENHTYNMNGKYPYDVDSDFKFYIFEGFTCIANTLSQNFNKENSEKNFYLRKELSTINVPTYKIEIVLSFP